LLSDANDATLGQSVDLREDLDRLCENVAPGARVMLHVKGDAESVPPFVALTVFRIVQESVTNAVRHAPAAAVCLEIVVDDERVSLRIENTMGSRVVPSSGSGRGLPGMFERAALVGGHLEAGPTKDGWLVAGWVPRDALPGGVEL
jgi:signal transduction histidine kinase